MYISDVVEFESKVLQTRLIKLIDLYTEYLYRTTNKNRNNYVKTFMIDFPEFSKQTYNIYAAIINPDDEDDYVMYNDPCAVIEIVPEFNDFTDMGLYLYITYNKPTILDDILINGYEKEFKNDYYDMFHVNLNLFGIGFKNIQSELKYSETVDIFNIVLDNMIKEKKQKVKKTSKRNKKTKEKN